MVMPVPVSKLILITRCTQYNLDRFETSSVQPHHLGAQDLFSFKYTGTNCKPGTKRMTYTAILQCCRRHSKHTHLGLSLCVCALCLLVQRNQVAHEDEQQGEAKVLGDIWPFSTPVTLSWQFLPVAFPWEGIKTHKTTKKKKEHTTLV